MSAAPITLDDLRTVDLFDELGDDELGEWVAVAREALVEPGDVVSEQGEEVQALMLLLDGTVQTFLLDGGRAEPVGRQLAPTWMGAIGILTGGPLRVRMQAETACRLALIEADDVRRLALSQPVVHQRVMSRVTPVMTRVAGIEQNRERLASLGTMAAGLAHELNNPVSAAQRTAAQMAEALDVVSSTLGRFVEAGISREDAGALVEVQREALASAESRTALDALDGADAEDELLARLEELGIPEPWRITDVLVGAGVDRSWLDRVASLAGPATDAAVAWVAATLTARGLAAELQESTQRMSTLVAAVKSYAYMDRGELVEVDLHEGLETTITILGHKLKHTEIDVVRDYDRDLPKLTVRAPELNQVWTNLLDNAIDALGDSGTITITTRHDGNCAYVAVTDDGPGIAPENLDRVFDSFFTTKDVGSGTGLGLATARQIVAGRHDGSLTVDSEPGRTTFQVSLPITKP